MKRSLFHVLPLVLLVPACKTAGPAVAPAVGAPDALRPYVGELRLLRHNAEKGRIQVDARGRVDDACAVAVQVRAAALERGQARFSLETLGVPRLKERRVICKRMRPELDLSITGLGAASSASELAARVDAVLQTAEGYLASNGVRFDLPTGKAPVEAASREVFATGEESALGRRVTAWPLPLLAVDAWYRDPNGRVRQESEIEMEAVVGTDGRVYRPRVRTGLSDVHANALLRTTGLWRFTPARRADGPVAARVALRPVLHIY